MGAFFMIHLQAELRSSLHRSAGDRLLIQKTVAAAQTSGGILLPEAAKEAPVTGKVVAVGAGKVDEDGTVKARHARHGRLQFMLPRPQATQL